jgi:hypothetical protein
MSTLKIVSQLILIAILNFKICSAAEYLKYESRQGRQESASVSRNDKSLTNSINLKCPKQEYIHPCDCLGEISV